MITQLAAQLRQITAVLAHFSPSSVNDQVLRSMSADARERLANDFTNMRLVRISGASRFYDMPSTSPDGTTTETTRVILMQGGVGEWLVISW